MKTNKNKLIMLHTKYWKTTNFTKHTKAFFGRQKREICTYFNTPTKVSTTAWLTKLTHKITEVWTPKPNYWSLRNDLFLERNSIISYILLMLNNVQFKNSLQSTSDWVLQM
jgi:hypothetical protein